jgi:hypothetical protein
MAKATPTTVVVITVLSPITKIFKVDTRINVFIVFGFRVKFQLYPKYRMVSVFIWPRIDRRPIAVDE